VRQWLPVLKTRLARCPGVVIEDKLLSIAVHYRQAPRLASHVHRTLRSHVAAALANERGWKLQPGKGVLEVKPDGRDKGTVILEYMEEAPFASRLPVFVGDDKTDEYGFDAVTIAGGWAVKVGRGTTSAQYRLPNVAAVRKWLSALGAGAAGRKRTNNAA
jgi:trehalose 6-phosphate phosphatase